MRPNLSSLWAALAGAFIAGALSVVALSHDDARAGSQAALQTLSDDERRTIEVYKRAKDAVVFISTVTFTRDPFDLFLGSRAREEGSGTGLVVDDERGIVLTNLHVIQDADNIKIVLFDGKSYRARLVGYDRDYDVAVLRLVKPPKTLTSIPFGDSNKLQVGQKVLAIGNPFGLSSTLTTGVVSSLDRTVRTPNGTLMRGLVQTDASINPGNSGGPLLDTSGRLIGMNTAILSRSGDSAGIGFAVPINHLKRILPELIATGKVLKPKIGWILADTTHGPMVRRVLEDSPADKAGVRPFEFPVSDVFVRGYVRDFRRGDLIVSVNGERVYNSDEVEAHVLQSAPSKPITFILRQGGLEGPERVVQIKPALG